jgi:hypothetical protein
MKEEERSSSRAVTQDLYEEGDDEGEYSDADDFIVDDHGRPIADKRKKRKPIFTDAYVYKLIMYKKNFKFDINYQ